MTTCKKCGALIEFRRTANDRFQPIDVEGGEVHFATCPARPQRLLNPDGRSRRAVVAWRFERSRQPHSGLLVLQLEQGLARCAVPPSRRLAMRTCPTCGEMPPPVAFGRPLVYCSPEHRKEMARRRKELIDLEEQVVEARTLAGHQFWPGRDHWEAQAARLERATEAAREAIPMEMRP